MNRAIIEMDIERGKHFYEEAGLNRAERETLNDYEGSSSDRGHIAPSADMETDAAMAPSFSLTNIVSNATANSRKT